MSISFLPPPSPPLPPFSTLLLKGDYPPTAALHLCLSYLGTIDTSGPSGRALIIKCGPGDAASKSRDSFEEYNEEWLNEHAGEGAIVDLLQRVEMLYPPTPAHLRLVLSLAQPIVPMAQVKGAQTPSVVMDPPPSMVVLEDLSRYFFNDDGSSTGTISSYMALMMEAIATLQFLCPSSPRFVLLDARLDELQLPIVLTASRDRRGSDSTPSPTTSPTLLRRQLSVDDMDTTHDGGNQTEDRLHDHTRRMIEQQFEWVGNVQTASKLFSSVYDIKQAEQPSQLNLNSFLESGQTHRLVLRPCPRQSAIAPISPDRPEDVRYWEWSQVPSDAEHVWTGVKATKIMWD